MISQIQGIIDKHTDVRTKLKLLDEFKSKIIEECEIATDEILDGYKYCSECDDWYKLKYFEPIIEIETTRECIVRDAGYGDDDIYGDVTHEVTYVECPKGHRIQKII